MSSSRSESDEIDFNLKNLSSNHSHSASQSNPSNQSIQSSNDHQFNIENSAVDPANFTTPALPISSISSNSSINNLINSTPISDPASLLPISPESLLRHVRQMRLIAKNRKISPNLDPRELSSSNSNIHTRAGSNASSTGDEIIETRLDEGGRTIAETLDLSHQRITDLTQPVVEELAEYVERLALGYNYLPVLPDHFTILGESLRYLNLRGNHMEIFPEVLTRMPSLEILDVSRNKIKAFPRRPGTLDKLRVLSVSRNRIRRLPNYVTNLNTLRVLKLDHNPIVWPPRELVTFVDTTDKADEDDPEHSQRSREDGFLKTRARTPSNEASTAMTQWLRTLQDWMRKNPYVRPLKPARPSTGETSIDPSDYLSHPPSDFDPNLINSKIVNSPEPSPILPLDAALSPSPTSHPVNQQTSQDKSSDYSLQHNRNASSSSSAQWVRKRPELRLKKSLPDLRRNHAEIIVERSVDPERLNFSLNRSKSTLPNTITQSTFPFHSFNTDYGPKSALSASLGHHSHLLGAKDSSRSTITKPSFNQDIHPLSAITHPSKVRSIKIRDSDDGDDRLAGDRNSGAYFRRLSMLPPSTISKQVPTPLLQLVDSIRGILFGLSQIYSALRQFAVFATQDRLPGALSSMTSAADDSMSKLINSLDRFDSSTRRTQPDIEIVREVFQSCRDNVVVFGKLVNVLSIQLKVLTGSADVRYSRTLLLSLHGATAEIAMSWKSITPLVDDVINFCESKNKTLSQKESKEDLVPHKETTLITPQSIKSEIYQFEHESPSELNKLSDEPPLKLVIPNISPPSVVIPSSANGRRHAGSFSVQDVQLGAILPPASAGLINNFSNEPQTPHLFNPLGNPSSTNSSSTLSPALLQAELSNTISSPEPLRSSIRQFSHRNPSSRSNGLTGSSLPLLTIGEGIAPDFSSDLPINSQARLSSTQAQPNSISISSPCSSVVEPIETNIPTLTEQILDGLSSTQPYRLLRSDSTTKTESRRMIPQPFHSDANSNENLNPIRHHSRIDPSLSRTDQDFLDMTEATIDIALSVTSMMLENLGQTTFENRTSREKLHEASKNEAVDSDDENLVERKRQGLCTKRLTKAGELKELCEIEIEVIKRLRVSLSNFWSTRNLRRNRRDGSGSSLMDSQDVSIPFEERDSGEIRGPEARKVFEDATTFVRAVIQTANLARATMTEYPLTKAIREGLGQLTKATKELATLLAVSSFKPGSPQQTSSLSSINSSFSSSTSASSAFLINSQQFISHNSNNNHINHDYQLNSNLSTPIATNFTNSLIEISHES
ncbi:hypothetical protein O181_047629 [Austropuccinia psidii MF-1]|uniref:Uncharacterized protein n=1 Tax=Austropuccinia psidii MF-1 TaxID=1389203 RepID=A0A9Q3DRE4_9BASI|nr:hypothetical protein [Austropuccinia psidii MF-1]